MSEENTLGQEPPESSPQESNEHEAEPFGDRSLDWLETPRRRRRSEPRGPLDRLRRKWRRWRRHRRKLAKSARWYRPRNIVAGIAVLLTVVLVSLLLSTYLKVSDIRRAPLLPIEASTSSVGTNIVLVSSNAPPNRLDLDPNTLVIQLIHLSANRRAGQVIDLPRNLVLDPTAGPVTLQNLYMSGGSVALVHAIQQSMGLTINHAVETSFSGYAQVSDDLGGVAIQTATGKTHFSGTAAQAYVAAPDLPGGTIETGQRYQHWSKAMLISTLQPSVLLNPFKLWSVFTDTTDNVIIDDTFSTTAVFSLMWKLRDLTPDALHFFTVPNAGYVTVAHQQVLNLNPTAFAQLSAALRTDNLASIGLFQ